MRRSVTAIGFDADDTLWENETRFRLTEERYRVMLAPYADPETVSRRLLETERRNLAAYGFGVKGFTLSLIETAIEITQQRIGGAEIGAILAEGRAMLDHPVELLPGARAAVERLSGRYRLVLVTKGDLFDQERKLASSGLGELFDAVEIVSDKSESVYARVFARHADGAERAVMVGNSLRSDILPALAAGAWGVHVPHALTWDHERAEAPKDHPRFRALASLAELEAMLAEIG